MASYESASDNQSTIMPQVVQGAKSIDNLAVYIPVIVKDESSGKKVYTKTHADLIDGILGTHSGGTGIDELTGGKLIASSADAKSLEEIDVNLTYLTKLEGNIQEQLDIAKSRRYTITVPITGWVTLESGGYNKDITIQGILDTDNPLVNLVYSGTTTESMTADDEAYGCLSRITTTTNKITLYCNGELPKQEVSISLLCTGV